MTARQLLAVTLLWLLLVPSSSPAQEARDGDSAAGLTHRRELWMLGISAGAGPGTIHNGASDRTMEEWGGVLMLRGGGMIHPHVLFHLEMEGWFRDLLVGSSSYKVDLFQYSLALTWYPFDPATRSGGWWLRGGLGLANVRVEPDGALSDQSYTEGGWNGLLAAGYEFRIGRTLALGLGVSFNGLGINGSVFGDGRWAALSADLNWYPE